MLLMLLNASLELLDPLDIVPAAKAYQPEQ
jgi:hypothetical protein